ncbi:alpha/beta hydrolase [Leifsonia sp. Root227]|uniref:alpha/beta hydrolase n=1 Tax=Leifsonia sp. Root227 TaxID=1736496 RepID=UPI0009EBDD39|nr:alpha/beta hydrolase [Leifsonia sp. Root227]
MGKRSRKRWYDSVPSVLFTALGLALATLAVVAFVNPWPSALLIRALFERGAAQTVAEMEPYVPRNGVDARRDISYGDAGSDTTLDVFTPAGESTPLTTVVWIHGGAWISGDKSNVDPYLQLLASHGYAAVGLNYTISPETTYPTALTQLNDALGFLVEHAAEYGIDPESIVLAGDSAGSQYASQLATMVTNPAYAERVGIAPKLTADQLRAVILNCGIYDVRGIPNAPGIGGWGFRVALWSYLGEKDWSDTAGGRDMSTIEYVTADFPTTWISGGNGDPLTNSQSKPLAKKLAGLGVEVTSVFYPEDESPALPHEYQFHLNFAKARSALLSTVDFLDTVSARTKNSD